MNRARDGTLVDVLQSRAQLTPDGRLLVEGQRRITNAMALDEAERIAHLLKHSGFHGPQSTVASFLTNRVEEHLWRLGTNLAGGIYVSLNREYRGRMLSDVLARSGAPWLITECAAWPVLSACLEDLQLQVIVFVDTVPADFPRDCGVRALDQAAWHEQPRWGGARCQPGDCASILFTSGTTGRPKAVRLPHNMFVRGGGYLADAWGLGPEDVCHAWSPAYHIGGQLYQFGLALVAGASCAILPTFSASEFWSQVDRFGCTYTAGFANVAVYLLAATPSDHDAGHGLRIALLAGLSPGIRQAFESRFHVSCVDSYGMTEAEPIACSLPGITPAGSCGPVNPDFAIRLVDEAGREVTAGSIGRVLIRANHPAVMMLGYGAGGADPGADDPGARDGKPDATESWFATHDLARLDAGGNFNFIGREKHALKRRGENVSPREVELTLLGLRGVKECAVLGIWSGGSAEPEIKAVVVVEAGQLLGVTEITAYCDKQLPRYMRPRYIEIVDALPYTEVGKLDVSGLSQLSPGAWDVTTRSYVVATAS